MNRTGNLESIGRLIARELRQTWLRCMTPGCDRRAARDTDFCRKCLASIVSTKDHDNA